MELFPGDGHVQRSRGFEDAGKREGIREDALAADVREVEEGGGETTVVNAAGDERGPGDDGARVGE